MGTSQRDDLYIVQFFKGYFEKKRGVSISVFIYDISFHSSWWRGYIRASIPFFYTCILFHKEPFKFSQGENATHSPFRLLWPTRGKNFWDPLGGECMHLFLRVEGRSP